MTKGILTHVRVFYLACTKYECCVKATHGATICDQCFLSGRMSNNNADQAAQVALAIKKKASDEVVRCQAPVHYVWITPENCRSLASSLIEERAKKPVTIIDPEEAAAAANRDSASNAFALLMQDPEDTPTDNTTTAGNALFQFSDDDDDDDEHEEDEALKPATAKRGRLEIASAASDMLLEELPEDEAEMPAPLLEELRALRIVPVVARSQQARISTIEDGSDRSTQEKGKDGIVRNARFARDIDWDIFMPNLFALQRTQMLMIGAVGFATMFMPALGNKGKSLSHTERIFEDIAKNTNMPRDHVFLKIPFPGAKKRDGCRAIPFGFLPLVLHYLRPASLRKRIQRKETRALLLQCYRDIVSHFKTDMPAIVQRQLRQFATNMRISIAGPIGSPLGLLSVRMGDINAEVKEESEEEEEDDDDESVCLPVESVLANIPDYSFSDGSEDPFSEQDPAVVEDEELDNQIMFEDDDGNSMDIDESGSEDVPSEEEEEEEEESEVEVRHVRKKSSLRENLLNLRYDHHTDEELDSLITHHLDVLSELNEVRRFRMIRSRPLREKLEVGRPLPPQRKPRGKRKKGAPVSLKRERPVPASAKKKNEEVRELLAVESPTKRVAVPSKEEKPAEQRPKKKLRVYRMQSNQLLSSLPEAIQWATDLFRHVMDCRPGFKAGAIASEQVEDEEYGESGDNFDSDDSDEDIHDLGSQDSYSNDQEDSEI